MNFPFTTELCRSPASAGPPRQTIPARLFAPSGFSGDFSGLDPQAGVPHPKKLGPNGPGGEQTAELSQADRGKKVFSANCATCHQANGLGVTGQYPPLAGSEYVNGGTRRLGMIVLKGLQGPLTVKGQ